MMATQPALLRPCSKSPLIIKVNDIYWKKGLSQIMGKLCPLLIQSPTAGSGRDTSAHLQIPPGCKDAV